MGGLLSARELTRDRVEGLIAKARALRQDETQRRLDQDAVVVLMFYEGSLRTRVGFEIAAARLGARAVTVLGPKQTSAMWAPEPLVDAVRSITGWCDALCLRHPDAEVFYQAASYSDAPVINCGNGTDEHPTQALVDLLAIDERLGRIDGLRVGLVGDLVGMRAAHSLVLALTHFDALHLRTITPPGLELPENLVREWHSAGHTLEARHTMDVDDLDVLYVAGLPADTQAGVLTVEQQRRFRVDAQVVGRLREGTPVLSPLPRIDEITGDVDALPQAYYFEQSRSALWARMALLVEILSGDTVFAGT